MSPTTGTMDISVLLATRFQSVAEFGMSTIQQVLAADVAAHNAIVQQMVGELCDPTTDRQRIYGSSVEGEMIEVDEYGRAQTQIDRPGATVGFPLRLFQYGLGWTQKYFQTHTPADMAIATQAAQQAHLRAITREIKKAIYNNANYTFQDHLVDKVNLAVKRFVNADSDPIPNGPNGETFAKTTHTHYLARTGGGMTNADVEGLINHVVEHGHGGMVKLIISRTDETTFRNLSGFHAYIDPRLTTLAYDTDRPGVRLDISRLDNRAIGILGAAEVWVKPWAIANYAFAYDASSPNKPLSFRQRETEALQGLRIAAQLDTHPLHAEYMEAEYGAGVWTRTNGAVLYFGGDSWTNPTITS